MNGAEGAGCVPADASVVEDRTDEIIDVRTIGLVAEETTIERSANIRRPIVLDGGVHVPHGRQLQTVIRATKAGKVRLIRPADPNLVWVVQTEHHVVEPGSASVDTGVGLANAVLALHDPGVTFGEPAPPELVQVELNTALNGKAPLVVGMARAVPRDEGGVADRLHGRRGIVSRPKVMRDSGDLRAAPGLIHPNGPDNVRDQVAGSVVSRG